MVRSRVKSSVAADVSGRSWLGWGSSAWQVDNHRRRNLNVSYSSDETHPLWNLHDGSGRYSLRGKMDIGGILDIVGVRYDIPSFPVTIGNNFDPNWIWSDFDGGLTAFFPFTVPDYETVPLNASQIVTIMPQAVDSLSSRFAQGGTAISRCAPARPETALTVSIVELIKDGVPSALSKLVTARNNLETARALGKDYLNVEFGWKPFVSDIRKTLQAIVDQERILQDLSSNSGRRIRRRYEFEPNVVTTENVDGFKPWPIYGSPFIAQAQHLRTTISTKKTWFAGEFSYRVPDLQGIGGVGAKARHLLGLDLTPSTIWNATPWTWLADWVGNTGDVLANIASITEDDLVMRYGYLMQETKYSVHSSHTGLQNTSAKGSIPSTISGSAEFFRKTRVGASPFGFGLTTEDFSPRQLAILAALGISRGR